ncbi:SGSM2 (predicted) [Pycnogonum litorale]
MAGVGVGDKEYKEKLIRNVKKEVKQIMEEAVTRKFVHEDSSSITSLCAAVEACLSHGLKRRALGLFKSSSTTALLQKVAKNFPPADQIFKMVIEIENTDPIKRSSSSSDSLIKPKISNSMNQKTRPYTFQNNPRYLWIRIALFEKQLAKIIDHVVQNSCKYYEKDALVAEPVFGEILASLLVGPCALDYSKMKTQDHFWTDPPADELVQRHRISSGHPTTPPVPRRPRLQYRRDHKSGSSTEDQHRSVPTAARDYVESLHQNNKATLLYGKNNVLVQPKEDVEPLPGYLSLHQSGDFLVIKWTPNQLMNGCYGESSPSDGQDKSLYWNYALNVNVHEIVYLHCHQQGDTGGTIVLVGQDGVQRPPIRFPRGGHLLAFLTCLETGLLPHGQMDPPLWSQRGKGKVFPKLKRKCAVLTKQQEANGEKEESDDSESSDYVFRIITSLKPESIAQELWDPKISQSGPNMWQQRKEATRQSQSSTFSSSTSSTSSKSTTDETSVDLINIRANNTATMNSQCIGVKSVPEHGSDSIQILCDTMKRQIISRAFYGWLAHCRHLRTVRTHLSGLVMSQFNCDFSTYNECKGLTKESWDSLKNENGAVEDPKEVSRLIYYGGCEHDIRTEVWPVLLGHYDINTSDEEKKIQDEAFRLTYESTMSEWLVVEAIVRQRDKELMAANLAKRSSGSANEEIPLVGKDTHLSNEVFEDTISMDDSDDNEDNSCSKDPKQNGESHFDDDKEDENSIKDVDSKCVEDEDDSHRSGSPLTLPGQSILVTNPSVDIENNSKNEEEHINNGNRLSVEDGNDAQLSAESSCVSPASSQGGMYTNELVDNFGLNLHRIDKDVQRCDRNYWYFTPDNLEKLRNIMCTYVWENLETGYVQGMCDLVAPLLVIFDDEPKTFSCFCELMKRMAANFPYGGAMDAHFANMRSLIQILDSEMFELMHQNGDYTHFYFCYRWFLLDFKRELVYDDIFSVWETIWAARHVASSHFVLFIALALVEYYREIILENNMDFTDIIKFFNEMAEHHDAKAVLKIARDLVHRLQILIDNK